jgi:uncharacterized membrane protein YvbJ
MNDDTSQTEAQVRAELHQQAHEPLLPIEKKLILWSLGIGLVMLVVLYFVSRMFPVEV